MTSRTRLIVLLVSAPLIAFAVIGGFLGKVVAREETYSHLRVFEDVVSLVMNNYVEQVNSDRVMRGAMRGLAEGLDPDSAYLSAAQAREVKDGTKLPAGDVGIELTRNYYLRVIAARDNSPAARAGIRPGDFVRLIDNKPTREMSVFEGTRLLRGEPGTKVSLTLIRGNAADPHVIDLVREPLPPVSVTGRMVEGVGVIRVPTFDQATPDQVKKEVATLRKAGASRLAIDIRSTATGPLEAGIAVARVFVPTGTLAIHESRTSARQPIAAASGDGSVSLPLVVLVDDGTSGPAEIFAAALAANHRAQLVGERTHGRAATQKLVPLPDGTALLLSSAWYLTPSGAQIQLKGLTPDVEVEQPEVEFGSAPPTTDVILQKAVDTLKARG